MAEPELIPESWTLGQCVYTMSNGKRCQKEAKMAIGYGSIALRKGDVPTYGFCSSHGMAVTKPRDPRIHRTAEPLTKVEEVTA